jgi:protoporphyrinogen oxidase
MKETNGEPERNRNKVQEFHTVVVGAGVAGLYCSWRLSRMSPAHTVGLFEGSYRMGGRIETVDFGPYPAEFGPMRFEKLGQTKLMGLLTTLGLETERFSSYEAERPDFPVYA